MQSPRVPEQCSIGVNEARWCPLIVCPVIVEVPTESGHLKVCIRDSAKFFCHYPVCPLRTKPDRHSVSSIPSDDKTKVGHLSKGVGGWVGGGWDFTSIATE